MSVEREGDGQQGWQGAGGDGGERESMSVCESDGEGGWGSSGPVQRSG